MAPTNHNHSSTREIDPRFFHLQEFRRTFNDIRRRQHMAERATTEVVNGQRQSKTKLRRHAVARASRQYASELEPQDPRKIYANILGVVPDYIEAEHALPDRHHRSFGQRWLSKEQWDTAKKHTIVFNDTLRDIIDQNPRLQPEVVTALMASAANDYNYSEDDRYMLNKKTEQVLHGMQHELAFESALYHLPDGFEVLDTTVTDDEHGADFMVRCPNGVIVSIDVKASPKTVEKALERIDEYEHKHHTKVPSNEIVLWSGFDNEDFTHDNPWRPTQESVERVLPYIEAQLLRASNAKHEKHSPALAR